MCASQWVTDKLQGCRLSEAMTRWNLIKWASGVISVTRPHTDIHGPVCLTLIVFLLITVLFARLAVSTQWCRKARTAAGAATEPSTDLCVSGMRSWKAVRPTARQGACI